MFNAGRPGVSFRGVDRAGGAEGAERRFHEDTILRADALLEILNCRTSQGV